MPHKLNPRTLQIDGFRWKVLQKPLYPPFAHNRNKCLNQNSLKYHSGNGTKKKDNPKLFSFFFYRKCLKTGPERRGEKVQISSFFSLGGAFRAPRSPHGVPGWLRWANFQDFRSIRAVFLQLFWCFRSDLLARFHGIASNNCFLLSFRSHQN